MAEPQSCFMKGSGGTIFKMDIPAEGTMARERWDEQIAKGDLVEVATAELVTRADGSEHWVELDAPPPKPPTPSAPKGRQTRGGKNAPAAAPTPPTDSVPTQDGTGLSEDQFGEKLAELQLGVGDVVSVGADGRWYVGRLAVAQDASEFALEASASFANVDAFTAASESGELVGVEYAAEPITIAIDTVEAIAAWPFPYDPDES